MTRNTTRLALTMAGLLCMAGSASAGKLADLLGSQGLKDAGTTAITGLTLTDAQVVELGAKSVAQMDWPGSRRAWKARTACGSTSRCTW